MPHTPFLSACSHPSFGPGILSPHFFHDPHLPPLSSPASTIVTIGIITIIIITVTIIMSISTSRHNTAALSVVTIVSIKFILLISAHYQHQQQHHSYDHHFLDHYHRDHHIHESHHRHHHIAIRAHAVSGIVPRQQAFYQRQDLNLTCLILEPEVIITTRHHLPVEEPGELSQRTRRKWRCLTDSGFSDQSHPVLPAQLPEDLAATGHLTALLGAVLPQASPLTGEGWR